MPKYLDEFTEGALKLGLHAGPIEQTTSPNPDASQGRALACPSAGSGRRPEAGVLYLPQEVHR